MIRVFFSHHRSGLGSWRRLCRGMSDWRASFLPQMSHIARELAGFGSCTCHLSVSDKIHSKGVPLRSPSLYVCFLVTYVNRCFFTKERNVVRNCCPQADRKRVTEHRPKRSKGTRESPSREPTQDQILCGRLTILRQPTHSFVAWTGFKPKREFRRCCVGWLSPKGASPPFTRQPRHTTMHQFEDEDDACRYKEKTSARSGTVGVSRVKVARAAGSIEEQSGWHAGRGATTRLDWATAPNGMGCGYHPPPKSQR
jgi:hypothetical protein